MLLLPGVSTTGNCNRTLIHTLPVQVARGAHVLQAGMTTESTRSPNIPFPAGRATWHTPQRSPCDPRIFRWTSSKSSSSVFGASPSSSLKLLRSADTATRSTVLAVMRSTLSVFLR